MKKEFEKLVPLWGISKKETESIDKLYDNEVLFLEALNKRQIKFLSEKDINILLKYYNKVKCVGCKLSILKSANNGICIYCGVRNN